MNTFLHKKNPIKNIKLAVICASTTRSLDKDESGNWIKKQAKKEGHEVVIHQAVTDDIQAIRQLTTHIIEKIQPDVIIVSGGTGISHRDVTIEAISSMFEKQLSGFGVLFTQLSFNQIDSAAMLSRATAGIVNDTIIFCIPGSIKACQLACNELIFPELGHILKHIRE